MAKGILIANRFYADLLYLTLVIVYIIALGVFLRYYLSHRKQSQTATTKRKKSFSGRRRGKKCPQCNNVVDYERETCQHCSYSFGGKKKKSRRSRSSSEKPKEEAGRDRQTAESGDSSHHRRRGKRCPQCKNIVDLRRAVCQHCGHKFPDMPAETKPEQPTGGEPGS